MSYVKQQITSNNGVENLQRQRGKPVCWVDEEGEYCSVRFVGYVGLFVEFFGVERSGNLGSKKLVSEL